MMGNRELLKGFERRYIWPSPEEQFKRNCRPERLTKAGDPFGLAAAMCEVDANKLELPVPPGAGAHYCYEMHRPAGAHGSRCSCGAHRTVHHSAVIGVLRERCDAEWQRTKCATFIWFAGPECYDGAAYASWIQECVVASWPEAPPSGTV